jgi:uncharacterized protein YbbC (DUF1343 family)
MNWSFLFSAFILLFLSSCQTQSQDSSSKELEILPGVYNVEKIISLSEGKSVAIVSNHTGLLGSIHVVDTLLSRGVDIVKVFAPEHGFRGNKSDGAKIDDSTDEKTGLPILSLYGAKKKPADKDLADVDLIIFDIQDVGARFYTYLSTLHYVMEAAAENAISVLVLDRPNPNGFYVDGPVMDSCCISFVGLHPVPIVYGMTIGEYARMINGEGWLKDGIECDLTIIPCQNYTHSALYSLPVKPSPNLPDMTAIYLYPSLCLFEGTTVSVGRGTDSPFKVVGEPTNTSGSFSFIPKSTPGASLNPKHKGDTCVGYNLSDSIDFDNLHDQLDLSWILKMYKETAQPEKFFNKNGYFENLAGTTKLREQIILGLSEQEIRQSWETDLSSFKKVREKYLIYPE